MITDRINNNLGTIFNTETDPIYKSLICDRDGNIPDTINNPTDIDIGAIASQIEYLRRLSIDLLKQIYINHASSEFLKYQLNEFFDSLRLEDETDVEWVQRTIAIVFQQKVSRATIIVALRPYSTQEPEISSVIRDSAYADFSYADVYVGDTVVSGSKTIHVLPAIAESAESSYYTIKITLYNTPSSDLYTVVDILDRIIAAGITYILEITYT